MGSVHPTHAEYAPRQRARHKEKIQREKAAFRIECAIYSALWCGFYPAVRNGSCFGARRHGSPVWLKRPWAGGFAKRAIPGRGWLFCVSINPCRACSLSSSQGELEGAKPASNRIKCRAKPCSARRAWSEASVFVPLRGTKTPALLQAVEKSQRLFRQPEEPSPVGDGSWRF